MIGTRRWTASRPRDRRPYQDEGPSQQEELYDRQRPFTTLGMAQSKTIVTILVLLVVLTSTTTTTFVWMTRTGTRAVTRDVEKEQVVGGVMMTVNAFAPPPRIVPTRTQPPNPILLPGSYNNKRSAFRSPFCAAGAATALPTAPTNATSPLSSPPPPSFSFWTATAPSTTTTTTAAAAAARSQTFQPKERTPRIDDHRRRLHHHRDQLERSQQQQQHQEHRLEQGQGTAAAAAAATTKHGDDEVLIATLYDQDETTRTTRARMTAPNTSESSPTTSASTPTPIQKKMQQQRQPEPFSSTPSSSSSSSSMSSTSPTSSPSRYDRDAWMKGFRTVESEDCYRVELPPDFPTDLVGTFYQNGPGKFHYSNQNKNKNQNEDENDDDDLVLHPFDGDGMVRAITFSKSTQDNQSNKPACWFRNRFVRTPEYMEELRKGRIEYRGVFGTRKNSIHDDQNRGNSHFGDLRTKNVANTNVLYHRGKLLALWDAGQPYELDPATLETRNHPAERRYRHAQLRRTYGNRYAAHYKRDPCTGTICNFSIYFTWPDPNRAHRLEVMEHDASSSESSSSSLLYRHSYEIPGLAVGHDMAITANYFCFVKSPPESIRFDPVPFVTGERGPAQCFEWKEGGGGGRDAFRSILYLIPRGAARREPISIRVPACFSFHTVNAYEEETNGRRVVVVDAVVADRMVMTDANIEKKGGETKSKKDGKNRRERPIWETVDFETDVPTYRLVRYRADVQSRKLIGMEALGDPDSGSRSGDGRDAVPVPAMVDFPAIHPSRVGREYRFAYLLGCDSRNDGRGGRSNNNSPGGPMQGVIKVDTRNKLRVIDQWMPQPHEFLSELVVAPKQKKGRDRPSGGSALHADAEEEDDVYLIGYMLDGKEEATYLVVFDAREIGKGPVSRAKLDRTVLPHSLHGTFVPGYAPEMTPFVQRKFPSTFRRRASTTTVR